MGISAGEGYGRPLQYSCLGLQRVRLDLVIEQACKIEVYANKFNEDFKKWSTLKKKEDLVLKEMHINPAICRCGELFKGKHNEKIAGVFDLFQGVKEDITEIVTFQLSFED